MDDGRLGGGGSAMQVHDTGVHRALALDLENAGERFGAGPFGAGLGLGEASRLPAERIPANAQSTGRRHGDKNGQHSDGAEAKHGSGAEQAGHG